MGDKIYSQNELTNILRSSIEDRAAWFYLLLKSAKEQGADSDKIAEKAIFQFGRAKGLKLGEASTPGEFVTKLSAGQVKQAFSMETVQADENKGVLKFRYCALVEAWKKLECSEEEIAHLCKLASCGDYGMISASPKLKLEFPQLLSKGDDYCELVVTKK